MKSKQKLRRLRWKRIFTSFFIFFLLSIIAIYVILFNYDLNSLKPRINKLVENATGRELTIGGNIHLQVSLAPRIIIEDIALKNATWGTSENMIHAKRIKLQVALIPLLSKTIIVKQLVISEPDILLEVNEDGKTNFEFKQQRAPEEETKKERREWPVFGSKKIIIENGRFLYNDHRSNKTYTAEIKRLSLKGKHIEAPVYVRCYGLYNDQAITAEGTIGPLRALSDPEEEFFVHLMIKAGGNVISIDGSIMDITSVRGLTVDFTSTINNPPVVDKLINDPLPIRVPFKLSGRFLAVETNRYQFPAISFSSRDVAFGGSVELNLNKKQPEIKAVITAEKLNFEPFFPDAPQQPPQKTIHTIRKKDARVFSSTPLPLTKSSSVDIDIQLKAALLRFPGVELNNLSTRILLKNGSVNIDDFKADMGEGSIDGTFHLRQLKETWNVETAMKVEQLPLNLLVPSKKVTDALDGDIDMLFSLRGSGKSIAEIMASLNGDFGLSMCDGIIATKYIDLLGADFSTSLVKMINPFQKKSDHTEVNCFVCILDIKDGMVQTKALVLDTGRTLTFGKGNADLSSEKLNISLKPVPKEGLGIDKIGKISISLSELYKPVKISGTLARPVIAFDPAQTAITLAKVAGGIALLGPAGVALALVTGRLGDDNPCLAAVEAVKRGNRKEGLNYKEKQGILEKTTNGITDRLKKLFGILWKRLGPKPVA